MPIDDRGGQIVNSKTQKARGLGDTVAKMTKAVGIKPCGGCKKRQEWLNKKVPYRQQGQAEAKQG